MLRMPSLNESLRDDLRFVYLGFTKEFLVGYGEKIQLVRVHCDRCL